MGLWNRCATGIKETGRTDGNDRDGLGITLEVFDRTFLEALHF